MLVAFHGLPGAGKSTFCRLVRSELAAREIPSLVIKIGAPLYEAQAVIHAMAGVPMINGDQQDGKLLNDLGVHFRRINPNALTDAFTTRVDFARKEFPNAWLLCDDMRAPDVDAVVSLGFKTVQITAPEGLRRTRKAQRGDASAGDDMHPHEAAIGRDSDFVVRNTGTLAELQEKAKWLIDGGLR